MKKSTKPLLGWAFNDVLNELHQHVFEGVPGESEPFELTLLEREYIAFVLAIYYPCEHCLTFHERAVRVARRKAEAEEATERRHTRHRWRGCFYESSNL